MNHVSSYSARLNSCFVWFQLPVSLRIHALEYFSQLLCSHLVVYIMCTSFSVLNHHCVLAFEQAKHRSSRPLAMIALFAAVDTRQAAMAGCCFSRICLEAGHFKMLSLSPSE